MAYQTGTITSAAELVAAIQSFAVANGWALAGGVLSKNGAHIRLATPSAGQVTVEGARNGNFVAPDLCPRYSRLNYTTWPASAIYHLAAFDNPDTLWCTINFDTITHAHLGFGSLQKYGTWDGGQWFHAQHTQATTSMDDRVFSLVDGDGPSYWGDEFGCALFWSQADSTQYSATSVTGKSSYLHCELRGHVWEATGAYNDRSPSNVIHCPTILGPIHKYNPNAFNGQTILTPFELFLLNSDGHYMSVGHVGHLRWLKLQNYEAGDIVEIGPDRWKVFPWHQIFRLKPNGDQAGWSNSSRSTGILGVAVRYDGP